MNRLPLIVLGLLAIIFGGCKQNSQEATPDLATALVGQFNATYLISPAPSQPGSSSGVLAQVRFDRKNNNTLVVHVRIDEGTLQVTDQYEANITPVRLDAYSQQEAGLRSRYSLTAANLSPLGGKSVSQVSLFQDGTIRAALGYVNSWGQTVSLGINL